MRFLDAIADNAAKFPQGIIVADETEKTSMTNARLADMSARVYSYLKSKGIGKEDPVVIVLPRCCRYIAAFVGILKAAAVVVPLEYGFPEDRASYICQNCKPKLVINEEVWAQMMKSEPLNGYEETDVHDAAYIVYTSGSTGNPKGVVHEVGSINRLLDNCECYFKETWPGLEGRELDLAKLTDRSLCVSPFYFTAAVIYIVSCLYQGSFLYIITYESFKNVEIFKNILIEQKITDCFLTPSYLSIINELRTPYLRTVAVGAERVCNLYDEKLVYKNSYGMTESGCDLCDFAIDKPYKNTPVGKPYNHIHLTVYDDDDNVLPVGEIGEVAFDNPYCRGYLNLPEQTAAVFRGGRYYTGDLGKFLPDGNLVILGRKDDMIKINGNRVEPAEIEAAVKDVLGIKWAYVQAFQQNDRSFVCAYYLDDIQVDPEAVYEKLAGRLPYYMIPAYYIRIDEIPRTASGKVDRLAFQPPKAAENRSPYVAPTTPEQKALCEAFATVLEQKQVGIRDDFYALGGDSLAAVSVLSLCNLPGLDVICIFKYRTVEKITENYLASAAADRADYAARSAEALKQSWPLLPHQAFFYKMQCSQPDALEYNLYTLMKFNPLVTPRALRRAINKALRSHPAFFTTLFVAEDGSVQQRYTPEAEKDIRIEWISEKKLLQQKEQLPHAFEMLNSRLYECRIFATPAGTYLFFDVHHIITDGTSLRIFMQDVANAFRGKSPKPDYYYSVLADNKAMMQSPAYQEAKTYLEATYADVTAPHMGRDTVLPDGMEAQPLIPLNVDENKLKLFLRSNAISRAEFFMGVAGLAQATSTRDGSTGYGWTYNCRDRLEKQDVCSCLITQMISRYRLHAGTTVGQYFGELSEQARKNIENSFYPFAFDILPRFTDVMTFIYQSDLYDFGKTGKLFRFVDIDIARHATDSFMQVDILDDSNGVSLLMNYNTGYFDPVYVQKYTDHYAAIVTALLSAQDPRSTGLSQLLQGFDYTGWVED